jgi:hypothetical protein
MKKDDIDFFTAGDIVQDFSRIDKIIRCGIFKPENALHPLVKSAFTEVMVCLNDLTHKAAKYGSRISFTEDVLIDNNVKDVTDLIRFIRDAMCHIHIYHHFVVPGLIKASFSTLYGKLKHVPFEPDHGIVLVSDYADDVCFFFGLQKIYLRRHIIRAAVEAQAELLPLPDFPSDILIYDPFDR